VKKLFIAIGVVVVVTVLILLNVRAKRGARVAVQAAAVERREVTKIVTGSGNIQPKRRVNVSASAMGKVTRVGVVEGQTVKKGDFLLQIDPLPYASSVEQLEAAVRGARAALEVESASLKKAEYDYERARDLHEQGFMSEQELRNAKVALEVAQAREKNAEETMSQQSATLKKAQHELDQVRITAEMSGVITALNVEEGESAIIGTINNPGTVLLTIADLSEMEAEVLVDETEVVFVKVGQHADVSLDAYPDTTFAGTVTEVGNSAVKTQLGLGQESVDFKVVVGIDDAIPNIRPGLSASVDITVAREENELAVPIQSLTVRDRDKLRAGKGGAGADTARAGAGEASGESKDIEGVFVVEDGEAHFRPIRVGIAGGAYFVVESGLEEGQKVVTGPFKAINTLRDGDRVKVEAEDEDRKKG